MAREAGIYGRRYKKRYWEWEIIFFCIFSTDYIHIKLHIFSTLRAESVNIFRHRKQIIYEIKSCFLFT